MRKKMVLFTLLVFAAIFMLAGCFPGDKVNSESNPAGFFWGIWHGWIAPISLIGRFFNKEIGIYEVFNTGFPYDFGFYMAIISGFGSVSLFRRRKG